LPEQCIEKLEPVPGLEVDRKLVAMTIIDSPKRPVDKFPTFSK
jgi:hypothetical protein